jgi:beta-1,4-mannosyl-glycoprotein beta-1,4-N-acetylglucosaminyltransferase
MKIIDLFPFFNEYELLKIRFEELYDVVDKFVIIESNHSFRGLSKPFNFENHIHLYEQYLSKVEYIKLSGQYFEDINKNKLVDSKAVTNITSNDIIIFGDIDEIPKKEFVSKLPDYLNSYETVSFNTPMYMYRLNGQVFNADDSPFNWIGSIAFKKSFLENKTLVGIRDHIRGQQGPSRLHLQNSGWHFTSVGTTEQLKDKFTNWTHWSQMPVPTTEYVELCVYTGKHFIPDFDFKVKYLGLENLPDCVINNKSEFEHIIK